VVTKLVVFAGVAGASLLVAAHCQGRLPSPWQYLRSFWPQVRASHDPRALRLTATRGLPSLVQMVSTRLMNL
jgi:hypothetical protein